MLIDAHIHIQDLDVRRLEAIKACKEELTLLSASVDIDNYKNLEQISFSNLSCIKFVGLHPWFLDKAEDDIAMLEDILAKSDKLGVGEIGLDKAAKNVDFALQKKYFIKQLDLAYMYNRPVVIHCVRAWSELVQILSEHPIDKNRCLLHAFSSSVDILKKMDKLGCYISLNIKYKQSHEDKFVDLLRLVDRDRLMLESDYPYMLKSDDYIADFKGFYDSCANILECSSSELKKQLELNLNNYLKII